MHDDGGSSIVCKTSCQYRRQIRNTASERSAGTQIRWQRGLQPSQEEFNLQEGRASARQRRRKPMARSNPEYGVREVHRHSDPMAERSATVTRRVQPARGKGFCEAKRSSAKNDVTCSFVVRRSYAAMWRLCAAGAGAVQLTLARCSRCRLCTLW